MLAEIAPHVDELNAIPRPPRSTPLDLGGLIDLLAKTSLLVVDPDEATLFVHRWTASELARRSHDQDHHEEIRHAHQWAAEYWKWRFKMWPQGREAEVHDLLEARHHLIACGDIEQAGTLTEYVCSQLDTWGAWDHETTLVHDTLVRLAPDSPRRPTWIHQLGTLAQNQGSYEEAERLYQQSMQINERLGNQAGMARDYHRLGIMAEDRGNYEEAERLYQQSMQINVRLGDQDGMASGYHHLGTLAQRRGDHEEAERRYQQCLQIKKRLGDQAGMAASYGQLGILAQDQENYEEAGHCYRRSLQISERLGNQVEIARSYSSLGNLAYLSGDYEGARHCHRQSLQINEQLGNQLGMSTDYHHLGMLAQNRGDYEEAERRYWQSLQIDERLGNQVGMATSFSQLGNLSIERRQYAKATIWHIPALLLRRRLQIPQVTNNFHALVALRTRMGSDAFVAAASTVVDDTQLAEIQAVLDTLPTDDSGEPEAR